MRLKTQVKHSVGLIKHQVGYAREAAGPLLHQIL